MGAFKGGVGFLVRVNHIAMTFDLFDNLSLGIQFHESGSITSQKSFYGFPKKKSLLTTKNRCNSLSESVDEDNTSHAHVAQTMSYLATRDPIIIFLLRI